MSKKARSGAVEKISEDAGPTLFDLAIWLEKRGLRIASVQLVPKKSPADPPTLTFEFPKEKRSPGGSR